MHGAHVHERPQTDQRHRIVGARTGLLIAAQMTHPAGPTPPLLRLRSGAVHVLLSLCRTQWRRRRSHVLVGGAEQAVAGAQRVRLEAAVGQHVQHGVVQVNGQRGRRERVRAHELIDAGVWLMDGGAGGAAGAGAGAVVVVVVDGPFVWGGGG